MRWLARQVGRVISPHLCHSLSYSYSITCHKGMEEQKALLARFDALKDLISKEDHKTILMAFNIVSSSAFGTNTKMDHELLKVYYNSTRQGNYENLEITCTLLEKALYLTTKVRAKFYKSEEYLSWYHSYRAVLKAPHYDIHEPLIKLDLVAEFYNMKNPIKKV